MLNLVCQLLLNKIIDNISYVHYEFIMNLIFSPTSARKKGCKETLKLILPTMCCFISSLIINCLSLLLSNLNSKMTYLAVCLPFYRTGNSVSVSVFKFSLQLLLLFLFQPVYIPLPSPSTHIIFPSPHILIVITLTA